MKSSGLNQSFIQKHKILVFGIIVFSVGITFYFVSWSFLAKMGLCESYNWAEFLPNASITTTCKFVGDVGQELTLRAVILPNGGLEPIPIPAHLFILNPDGVVLYDMNFDAKTIISFKPELAGNYTATITSLEDPNNRIYCCQSDILYGFGFLTGYDDVHNPIGNSFVWMAPIGNVLFLLGIAVLIYVGIKSVRKKS